MIPLALILRFAPYAAAGAACVALATFTPVIGFNARLHHVEHARADYRASAVAWHRNADGWKASRDKSEALRVSETQQSRQAVEAETTACSVRVAEARKSAEAIKRIVERPVKVDANQCPVRETVSADDLKAALGAR